MFKAKIDGIPLMKQLKEYSKSLSFKPIGNAIIGSISNIKKFKAYRTDVKKAILERARLYSRQLQIRITIFTSYSFLFSIGYLLTSSIIGLSVANAILAILLYVTGLFFMFKYLINPNLIIFSYPSETFRVSAEFLWYWSKSMKRYESRLLSLLETLIKFRMKDLALRLKFDSIASHDVLSEVTKRMKPLSNCIQFMDLSLSLDYQAKMLESLGDYLNETYMLITEIKEIVKSKKLENVALVVIASFTAGGVPVVAMNLSEISGLNTFLLPVFAGLVSVINGVALSKATSGNPVYWGLASSLIYAFGYKLFLMVSG